MNYNQPFRGAQNMAARQPDPPPPEPQPEPEPEPQPEPVPAAKPAAKQTVKQTSKRPARQPAKQTSKRRPKQAAKQRDSHGSKQRRPQVSELKFAQLECIDLSQQLHTDKRWLCDRLVADPSQLGLGELELVERRRSQQASDCLDLLFTDTDPVRETRYAVEVQLGAADADHLIRAIERWSHERQQHPECDHVAVIVAEEVSGRLLEVMSLFGAVVPLIALQVTAVKVAADTATLVFTRLSGSQRAEADAASGGIAAPASPKDRAFWELKLSPRSLAFTDELLGLIQSLDGDVQPHYAKGYIGLARRGRTHHYVKFTPNYAGPQAAVQVRLPYSAEQQETLEAAGIEFNRYYEHGKSYSMTITSETLSDDRQRQTFEDLLNAARAYWQHTMPPSRAV